MKNFASASFFRLFDRHVRPPTLGSDEATWTIDDVEWTRSRHSFRNPDYGQTIEACVGVHRGRKPWKIMVVRELWWVGPKSSAARSSHWAQLISGDRAAALAWFKALEGPVMPLTSARPGISSRARAMQPVNGS